MASSRRWLLKNRKKVKQMCKELEEDFLSPSAYHIEIGKSVLPKYSNKQLFQLLGCYKIPSEISPILGEIRRRLLAEDDS